MATSPTRVYLRLRWQLLRPVLLEPVFLGILFLTFPAAQALGGAVLERGAPMAGAAAVATLLPALVAASASDRLVWRSPDLTILRPLLADGTFFSARIGEGALAALLVAPAAAGLAAGAGVPWPTTVMLLLAGSAWGAGVGALRPRVGWLWLPLLLISSLFGAAGSAGWLPEVAQNVVLIGFLVACLAVLGSAGRWAPRLLAGLPPLEEQTGGRRRSLQSAVRSLPLPRSIAALAGRDLALHLRGAHPRHWLLLGLAGLLVPWGIRELQANSDERMVPLLLLQAGSMGVVAIAYGLGPDLARVRAPYWALERVAGVAPRTQVTAAVGYAVAWTVLFALFFSAITRMVLPANLLEAHGRGVLALVAVAVATPLHAVCESLATLQRGRVRGEGPLALALPVVALATGLAGAFFPPALLALPIMARTSILKATAGVERWSAP